MEVGLSTVLVSNGSIDYKGNLAHKHTTGGWRAAPFIIVNEVAERLAFFGIAVHMASYLSTEMNQPLPNAAAHHFHLDRSCPSPHSFWSFHG
ncbi:unnamed protein product [Rhodiola kirilowii]